MTDDETRLSSYLDYLPAVYRRPELGRFLLAFEQILHGGISTAEPGQAGPGDDVGLSQLLDGLADFFDPTTAPSRFLPWLATWVDFPLWEEWDEDLQRQFLSRAVQLFRRRGTKEGLAELLRIYTGLPVTITEPAPHHFEVELMLSDPKLVTGDLLAELNREEAIARALIEREKPAHTTYTLHTITPTLQIRVRSTVGVDTLLGTAPG